MILKNIFIKITLFHKIYPNIKNNSGLKQRKKYTLSSICFLPKVCFSDLSDLRIKYNKTRGLFYPCLFTSLALAWAVGIITISFRQTWGGRVIAKRIVSAISSFEREVIPLYTLAAASASPL